MSFVNILRFKKPARALSVEEIRDMLQQHRYAGSVNSTNGWHIACLCGEKFPDNWKQRGMDLLLRHIAIRIHKLQEPQS